MRNSRVSTLSSAFQRTLLLLLCMGPTHSILHAQEAAAELQKKLHELTRRYEEERDKPPSERSETLQAIGALKTPEAAAFLTQVLREKKEQKKEQQALQNIVKQTCVLALGEHGSREAVTAIVIYGFNVLPERGWWVIREALEKAKDPMAVDWLVSKGWKTTPALPPKAQQILVGALMGCGDPRAADAASRLVANRKCPPDVQVSLVKILKEHKHKGSAKKVAKLYRYDHKDLKVAVLLALQAMEASEHSKIFYSALSCKYWEVRSVGVDIFGHTHDPEVLEKIVPLLEDKMPQVQVAAVHALRRLGGKESVDALVAALPAVSGRVQDDIADVLLWLTGKDFGVDVVAWESWWEQKRETAEVVGISRADFDRIRAEQEGKNTGVYYGLRVISEFVTFIIDSSGSMEEPYNIREEDEGKEGRKGSTGVRGKKKKKKKRWVKTRKIKRAQQELVRALDGLKKGTEFNVIQFSGSFTPWRGELTPMSDESREESIEFVQMMTPGGMTNVYETLIYALEDPKVNTIYFLSDGAPTMGTYTDTQTILEKVAEKNQARKVKIHTIGFHLKPEEEELMRQLAEQNYGHFVQK